MSIQSEQELENNMIDQLVKLGYTRVIIPDEAALLANLQRQLEKHNNTTFTESEFSNILNHLHKGNIFQRAKTLRGRFNVKRDDGTSDSIEFLNQTSWCQNEYQVSNQITIFGKRKNRYDVTLLVNGLPLCQIELKKRGVEMKKAFHQINRYHRDSYGACYGLFQYVQIFAISNGVNSVYYSNNRKQDFAQTIYWTHENNMRISNIDDFTQVFLEPCHLSKMICRYIVLNQSFKILMVLRPYQYYAAEAILKLVKESTQNGYIWHTTGSGKTLTSFKASQLIAEVPEVHKILFVVDRNDLDFQTQIEFNHFSDGSVDGTNNTRLLVDQLTDKYIDPNTKKPKVTKLIVTTIQKLRNAITRTRYSNRLEGLKDKKIVFLFDECHRSQFGETHASIKRFFTKNQMIGFTGTPIFNKNMVRNKYGKWVTEQLFDQCLHKYLITNAIRDKKVLKFSIEYVGKYKKKDGSEVDLDIPVEIADKKIKNIDKKELFESDDRINKIVKYIQTTHDQKTKNRKYSAILCTSNVDLAIKYYDVLKAKKEAGEHDLRIASIFTYAANPPSEEANGMIEDEKDSDFMETGEINIGKRDKLDSYVTDYNAMFGGNHSVDDSKGFENYKNDISKRLKNREKENFQDKDRLDILIVAYMFLTGFDAKMLNTMYVDKNLKYHGLIQAFSRTNRIIGPGKSHGNIICFRNLKEATDDAIALFSDPKAKSEILMKPYDFYVKKFKESLEELQKITPTVDSVDHLMSEDDIKEFVLAYREVMRYKNIMTGFSDYTPDDLGIEEQTLLDYQGKYLDIKDTVTGDKKGKAESIVNEIDFETELIIRDEINVAYILKLLAKLYELKGKERAAELDEIKRILGNEIQLRSKKELIEKFIEENLLTIKDPEDIGESFDEFWMLERRNALIKICETEDLNVDGMEKVIADYLYTGRVPLSDAIRKTMNTRLGFLEDRKKAKRVIVEVVEYVERFEDGYGE